MFRTGSERFSRRLFISAIVSGLTVFGTWLATEIWQAKLLAQGVSEPGAGMMLQGVLVAAVIAVALVILLITSNRQAGSVETLAADAEANRERIGTLVSDIRSTAHSGEDAGRRLTAQVGETLASIAQIASRTVDTSSRVHNLAEQVAEGASAVEEIQGAVTSLASQIESQKVLVSRNTAAVDQMTVSISNVAGVANEKRAAAEELLHLADQGKATVATTESLIAEVGQCVGSIHSMATMINSIAANTNLLAMNAAIEAAHAGSYGRGFAVVAEEIRNLAESSATNAKHISQTLKQLTGKIDEAQTAGVKTGRAFQELETGVGTVVAAFQQIARNTDEISQGTGEVKEVTSSLEQISSEISGSAQEMTYGAKEVTNVLTTAREAAANTSEAMGVIAGSARSLNNAVLQISSLSVETNDQVLSILAALGDFDSGNALINGAAGAVEAVSDGEDAAATERLKLANVMLKHLTWLGRVRSLVDGTGQPDLAELTDPTKCDLGRWLGTDGKALITDQETFRRLSVAHEEVHGIAREILDLVGGSGTAGRSGVAGEARDVDRSGAVGRSGAIIEQRFRELLAGTRKIVEILTSLQQTTVVQWSPSLAVDVNAFDNHHRRLLGLVNRLYHAMQSGSSQAVMEKTFDELLDYTGYHFGAEEKTFEHFGYPQCEFHKQQHQELVEKAVKLRSEMESGKALVAVEVMEFLRDWVTKHIKGCDKLYSGFFKDKDVDAFLRGLDGERAG